MLKRFIIVSILIVFILPVVASANMDKYLPSEKAWALQFSINQNFKWSSFHGATISLKKHTSLNRAWRLGVTSHAYLGTNDGRYYSDGILFDSSDDKNTDLNIVINLIKLYYLRTKSNIYPYFGAGPTIEIDHKKSRRVTYIPEIHRQFDYLDIETNFSAGVILTLGVEWFPVKYISLLAEYSSSILYDYNKRDLEDDGEKVNDSKNEGVRFAPSEVKFGLSAYF